MQGHRTQFTLILIQQYLTYPSPCSISGTFSATFSCFVVGNIFFAFLDYFQWPHFLYKYKIQTGKMPDQKKIVKLIKGVTTNLVISFVLMELSWPTVRQSKLDM